MDNERFPVHVFDCLFVFSTAKKEKNLIYE